MVAERGISLQSDPWRTAVGSATPAAQGAVTALVKAMVVTEATRAPLAAVMLTNGN